MTATLNSIIWQETSSSPTTLLLPEARKKKNMLVVIWYPHRLTGGFRAMARAAGRGEKNGSK
jgi:hypothetical protein